MAYNITLTNGQNLVTVADGTIDTNYTSLTLVGKNFAGYGSFLNENFVKMVENFANTTEPPNALQGQVWWDTANKLLKVRSGNTWKSVSSSTTSPSTPVNPTVGDMWWDTGNTQLKVWSGSAWIVIGPAYTAAQGKTGIEASVVTESVNSVSHIIVKFWVNNVVAAVLSRDPSFVTSNIPNFTTINPGFNLASGGSTPLAYYGDANNALNLGGFPAADYMRSTQTTPTFDFPLWVNNNSGATIGTQNDYTIDVTNTQVGLKSNISGKDVVMYVNVNGVPQDLLTLDAQSGAVLLKSDPTQAMAAATKQYVDAALGSAGAALMRDGSNRITGSITPVSNHIYDLGSATLGFASVYASVFSGDATNALSLGGIAAASHLKNNGAMVSITNNNGLSIGTNGDYSVTVDPALNVVYMNGNTTGRNLAIRANINGNLTTVFAVDATSGLITVAATPSGASTPANIIATKGYVDSVAGGSSGGAASDLTAVTTNILPVSSNNLNIGTPSLKWNTVYATTFVGVASEANYADLAERFESDKPYTPGTVVELGGPAEIMAVDAELSENVFGVISTRAAYLMNAGAGSNDTHPPIAMQGRVPVNVIGKVKKGDRLVSAGNGMARAASRSEISPFNVIGRALTDKTTTGEGTVEAIVKLNS